MIMPLDQVLTENQEKHLINEDTIERYNQTFRSFALPLIIELKKLQHLNASLLNSEFYFLRVTVLNYNHFFPLGYTN